MRKDTNKRKHSRHTYAVPIDIVISESRVLSGNIVNISLGGAFIASDPLPAFGAKVKLKFTIPGVPKTAEVPCIVRWTKNGIGAGVQFEHLRAIEVWALNKLIASLNVDTYVEERD